MPIHDWTRVPAGRYHHFHQRWALAIADILNTGGLPPGYSALAEQRVRGPEPDVVTIELDDPPPSDGGGVAVLSAPPQTRYVVRTEAAHYARRADRLMVRKPDGRLATVIELVSPGNKDGALAIAEFVAKVVRFLRDGVHALVIDPFPPTPRDPHGIHKAIWDAIHDEPFELPPDKPLTLVSYASGADYVAYVEPVAVGDVLPDMPLFLTPEHYVPCPLEAAYQASWATFPAAIKRMLEVPPR